MGGYFRYQCDTQNEYPVNISSMKGDYMSFNNTGAVIVEELQRIKSGKGVLVT